MATNYLAKVTNRRRWLVVAGSSTRPPVLCRPVRPQRTLAPPQLPLLKRLLKQLAALRKRPGGGVWVLKADFGGGGESAAGGGAGGAGAGASGSGGAAGAGPSTSRQRNDFEGLDD